MNYIELIILTGLSFLVTYILVPLNIKLTHKWNLVDAPHDRGVHESAVPVGGGLAFAVTAIIFQIVLSFYFIDYTTRLFGLIISGTLIMILGLLDDKKKFTAKYKLLFQILIVVFIYFTGFKIEILTNPFGDPINLGLLSFPITMIWFLLIINAFNLIDGMDGLATGISIIAALVLFAVALKHSNILVAALSLILIGSCSAFLRFNFYPARIFMGDTGSMFLGLNLAAVSVIGIGDFKGITAMTLIIPIIVLIIPIADTLLTILRRIKGRKHIFQADKEHLHHKMMNLGFSQKNIALISYFITLLFGLIAFGFSFTSHKILFVLLLVLLIIIFFLLYSLIKKEFWK
jgi:UDP-GlcNAc:undecaprenyl-phosphate/decaprenyl-phosphate GlcNAc-1-phosphate transferase